MDIDVAHHIIVFVLHQNFNYQASVTQPESLWGNFAVVGAHGLGSPYKYHRRNSITLFCSSCTLGLGLSVGISIQFRCRVVSRLFCLFGCVVLVLFRLGAALVCCVCLVGFMSLSPLLVFVCVNPFGIMEEGSFGMQSLVEWRSHAMQC